MTQTPDTRKAWTFMVYMAGDNDLAPEGPKDLQEMKRVGSTDELNIVAQFDRRRGHAAKRYFLRRGGDVAKDVVANVGEVNTGDPKRLVEFVSWAVEKYPAERYALVLWNHGEGWDDSDVYVDERFKTLRRASTAPLRRALFQTPVQRMVNRAQRDPVAKAILIDDNAKDFLDNHEMKAALVAIKRRIGHNLDLLGMDACLMSMIEVAYQVRQSVNYVAGSEDIVPGNGWPYNQILRRLAATPSMSTRELGAFVVDRYVASYKNRDAVTYAAGDVAQVESVAAAIRDLASSMTAGLRSDRTHVGIMKARARVQTFDATVRNNVDLIDLCRLMAETPPNTAIGRRAKVVADLAASRYIVAQGETGKMFSHACGVSIYFPTATISPLYSGLDFSARTGWDKFLWAYLSKTTSR